MVIGAGVAGDGIASHLAETTDEPVFALSRWGTVPVGYEDRVQGVACDLLDESALAAQLAVPPVMLKHIPDAVLKRKLTYKVRENDWVACAL